ncbi:hypothetical protein BDZ94DRAFT_1256356 [Collybia nuda]|uniref:Uncharacterized protein n=1 Tax=Collybia nuda TaxID=64659 RepID=A0A9P5Y8U6_9AGAR|nr:hypothetical protein BDZ94DRAFT_1256356 [Collybia nuda]
MMESIREHGRCTAGTDPNIRTRNGEERFGRYWGHGIQSMEFVGGLLLLTLDMGFSILYLGLVSCRFGLGM